jgi:hypothetical protein
LEANIVSMNLCEVCKAVVKNLNKDIETHEHRKEINNSIILNEYFNSKKECVICNREVQNLRRHDQTNAHRKRLNYGIFASSSFYCDFCDLEMYDIGVHEEHPKIELECLRGEIR